MPLPVKTFSYQLDVEDVPYNKDTAKELFGGGYIEDYPEDTCAREVIYDLVKDAICSVLETKSNFICQNKIEDTEKLEGPNKQFWLWLEAKEERYRKIEASIKPLNAT